MNKGKRLLAVILLFVLCMIGLILSAEMLGHDTKDWIPSVFLSPTPGPSPTPKPFTYAVTPLPLPFLSERKQQELDQRAQTLYGDPDHSVEFEIKNPLFKRTFPRASMYAVKRVVRTLPGFSSYETMVSYKDTDYIMPQQFNQLMFDAGHELTVQTRDDLAHAFIIAALPTPMAAMPITCDDGVEINEDMGIFSPYIYKVHCHAEPENLDFIVKFSDLSIQFRSGYMTATDESGKEIFGHNFSAHRVTIEGE
ncbi:MAG: hypothetical protein GY832_01175 [Chloroflexi bacterium]|nr:hypothetical protein [Chloroflexota bacterium]